VTDSNGLSSSNTQPVRVRIIPRSDIAKPNLEVSQPLDNTIVMHRSEVAFSATAFDEVSGDISGGIRWHSNIDRLLSREPSFTSSRLSLGVHSIVVSVRSREGLMSDKILTVTVQEDVNEFPTVRIILPEDGIRVDPASRVRFEGQAQDTEDGNLSDQITWSSNRDGVLGSGAFISLTSLSEGEHTILAQVVDSAGQSAEATIDVRVQLEGDKFVLVPILDLLLIGEEVAPLSQPQTEEE